MESPSGYKKNGNRKGSHELIPSSALLFNSQLNPVEIVNLISKQQYMQKVQFLSYLFFTCLLIAYSFFATAAAENVGSQQYHNKVYVDNIKTVQLHVKGLELSYPVIELGSREELIFSFDDLDGDVKNYQYTIIHCNADWTRSSLFPSDYMDGFYENPLDNYQLSFNTFVSYTHYSLTIPGYDLGLKLPGNYIVKVFEDFDQDNVVLTKRFMIAESRVQIQAHVHRPRLTRFHQTGQQISINIHHPELQVANPHSELLVTVMKNGRHDNILKDIKPTYIRSSEIVYEHDNQMVFNAGNEYRNFDTKSLRYQTEFIRNVEFSEGFYHIELQPARSRGYARYFSHHDINGRFLIRNEEGRDPSTDADYVMVYFTLPWDVPYDNGDVYVLGALSDWNFYNRNRMTYNYESKAYELSMLLKQGYYNYQFVFLEDSASEADATPFEGSFFETENDYFIMVYHRLPGSRFDRLVGTQQINSRRQTR